MIADAFSFLSIKVFLRKLTIEPTKQAMEQADDIALDLNPDLTRDSGHWV
jgi:hypothetical protein